MVSACRTCEDEVDWVEHRVMLEVVRTRQKARLTCWNGVEEDEHVWTNGEGRSRDGKPANPYLLGNGQQNGLCMCVCC